MKTIFTSLLIFCSCLVLHAQQASKYLVAENGQRIGFLESLPDNYGKQKHPVIIFLHGTDERGNGETDLGKVARNGIPKITASKKLMVNGQGFIVLSPQLDKRYGAWESFYIDEMLKYAATLSIDTNRIYLTGLSLGGGAVWAYASDGRLAAKFAAIVPVCGVCFYDYQKLQQIAKKNLPVWAFVGDADKVVNPVCTTQAVDAVNAAGTSTPAKKTVYKSVGHNAWDRAYDPTHKFQRPNVYEWMLLQTKKPVSKKL